MREGAEGRESAFCCEMRLKMTFLESLFILIYRCRERRLNGKFFRVSHSSSIFRASREPVLSFVLLVLLS